MVNRTELPQVLRDAGLKVTTVRGWETRTTKSGADFTPSALCWHHDASPVGDSPGVVQYMLNNWESAGAQLWVDRYGGWTVLACGKANHAGAVIPGAPGNARSYGVETDHTTGEAWPAEQLAGLRVGTVAILKWLGRSSTDLHFHKTICNPKGRKSDPDGLNLADERVALAALWNPKNLLTEENDMTPEQNALLVEMASTVKASLGTKLPSLVNPAPEGNAWMTDMVRAIDVRTYRSEQREVAANAAIEALTKAVAAQKGMNAEELLAGVKQAIAEAVVKVDVKVSGS